MGFRRFSITFFILMSVFLGLNALIWFGWVREIVSPSRVGGDLLRVGYLLGPVSQRKGSDDLPRRHIKSNEYSGQHIDMVTVGDSFSTGSGGGRNRFYQDYIASLHGMAVLNVPVDKNRATESSFLPVITLSKLINSGYLDVIKPKYLLLESVERFTVNRFTKDFSLLPTATIEELERSFHASSKQTAEKSVDFHFINNGNWKFLNNNYQYLFQNKPSIGLITVLKLNRRFFSSYLGDKLIFASADVNKTALATPESVAESNQNLNRLAAVLRAKGITLVFMPVVDKFNLYEPYLKRRDYPRSIYFEELRKLPKEYLFIDTKQILSRALENGELDIFYQDDTHWNWKASEAIFKNVRFEKVQQ